MTDRLIKNEPSQGVVDLLASAVFKVIALLAIFGILYVALFPAPSNSLFIFGLLGTMLAASITALRRPEKRRLVAIPLIFLILLIGAGAIHANGAPAIASLPIFIALPLVMIGGLTGRIFAGIYLIVFYAVPFLGEGFVDLGVWSRSLFASVAVNGLILYLIYHVNRLLAQKTELLEQTQQQLVLINEQSRKQTQMFSIIGHELRTPLSSMKMMEEAMGLRNIGEYGANICESTDAVLNIVDDLRTVINPDKAHQAQAVVDSPFDVLSRTTRSLEGLYEQEGVEVIVSSNQLSHSLCKFNAQALRQKITNLTKNAAIHADAETVWVDLQAQPNGGDKVDLTLIVEDNGKGIPEGLREAVFGAFSRGDTRADGTGLGLYITRELAEKLGGTVEYFESEKGGAGFRVEFTLDLHLDAIGQENELDETVIPVALKGKRILFAEDQKTLQLLTSKLLKDAGAVVVVCDNGKQALEAFRAGEFDIVLTDLMMPEMSGDELIRHIRADGFTGQVVALTAAIIGKETEKLIEAGADAVLNKPLDIHAMKRTIAGLAMKGSAA